MRNWIDRTSDIDTNKIEKNLNNKNIYISYLPKIMIQQMTCDISTQP